MVNISISKKVIVIIFIVAIAIAAVGYMINPEFQVFVNNGIASASIILNGFVESVVTTPWWQAYFAPYLLYWGMGVLAVGIGVGAILHKAWYQWRVSGGMDEAQKMLGIQTGSQAGLGSFQPSGQIQRQSPPASDQVTVKQEEKQQ